MTILFGLWCEIQADSFQWVGQHWNRGSDSQFQHLVLQRKFSIRESTRASVPFIQSVDKSKHALAAVNLSYHVFHLVFWRFAGRKAGIMGRGELLSVSQGSSSKVIQLSTSIHSASS